MELGGLWLVGSLQSDLDGQKFHGKSLDTYDAAKTIPLSAAVFLVFRLTKRRRRAASDL